MKDISACKVVSHITHTPVLHFSHKILKLIMYIEMKLHPCGDVVGASVLWLMTKSNKHNHEFSTNNVLIWLNQSEMGQIYLGVSLSQ